LCFVLLLYGSCVRILQNEESPPAGRSSTTHRRRGAADAAATWIRARGGWTDVDARRSRRSTSVVGRRTSVEVEVEVEVARGGGRRAASSFSSSFSSSSTRHVAPTGAIATGVCV
jgi:hypothetical protein